MKLLEQSRFQQQLFAYLLGGGGGDFTALVGRRHRRVSSHLRGLKKVLKEFQP